MVKIKVDLCVYGTILKGIKLLTVILIDSVFLIVKIILEKLIDEQYVDNTTIEHLVTLFHNECIILKEDKDACFFLKIVMLVVVAIMATVVIVLARSIRQQSSDDNNKVVETKLSPKILFYSSRSVSIYSSKVMLYYYYASKNYSKDPADLVTINEKVNLTKDQHEVLNIICNTYQISISEYMQQALVEAMKFDREEGNFCDTLLEKIDDDKKDNNSPSSPAPDLMNSDPDLLKKLQTRYHRLHKICSNFKKSYVTGHINKPVVGFYYLIIILSFFRIYIYLQYLIVIIAIVLQFLILWHMVANVFFLQLLAFRIFPISIVVRPMFLFTDLLSALNVFFSYCCIFRY